MKQESTKAQIRAWHERWRIVNEAEIQELRATSMDEKFRQLAAMMQTAIVLGWESSTPQEIDVVRQRWARLRSRPHDA